MKTFSILIIVLIAGLKRMEVVAQGCSDAGVCTVDRPYSLHQNEKVSKHSISFQTGFGTGDEQVFVFTPALQYRIQLNKKWLLQGKVSANYAGGDLGSATGLGDAYIATMFKMAPANTWQIQLLTAVKIPLNDGNLKSEGRSLPMQYQSSLGTFDVIAGFTMIHKRWLISAAFQLPLTGVNGNNFLPEYWTNAKALRYPPSNDLRRKSDLLIKSAYNFYTGSKISLNGGLLAIYHTGEDTFINGNISNLPIRVRGSKGLTLNIAGEARMRLSSNYSLVISAGVPAVVRDVRPDGLTRRFVFTPEIIYHFK